MSVVPDRPDERRVIVALGEAEFDRCSYDSEGRELLRSSSTWVVPLPLSDQLRGKAFVAGLVNQAALYEGAVLLQDPYDFDQYTSAESFRERAALEKHLLFSELCGLLGAKRVRVSSVSTVTENGTTTVQLGSSKKAVKGEVKIENDELASFVAKLDLDDVFSGDPVDGPAARDFLANHHLDNDPVMTSLVRARTRVGALLSSRTFTVDVTQESNSRLKALAGLQVPLFVKASAEFQRARSRAESLRVSYKVTF